MGTFLSDTVQQSEDIQSLHSLQLTPLLASLAQISSMNSQFGRNTQRWLSFVAWQPCSGLVTENFWPSTAEIRNVACRVITNHRWMVVVSNGRPGISVFVCDS